MNDQMNTHFSIECEGESVYRKKINMNVNAFNILVNILDTGYYTVQ